MHKADYYLLLNPRFCWGFVVCGVVSYLLVGLQTLAFRERGGVSPLGVYAHKPLPPVGYALHQSRLRGVYVVG